MKKLIFKVMSLSLVAVFAISCEKEAITPSNQTSQNEVEQINYTTKEAPSKGEIACSIKNSAGEEIAAGKRCGTPTGECGKETECKAITLTYNGEIPEGMTYEEFANKWNNDETRQDLINLGFYAVDRD